MAHTGRTKSTAFNVTNADAIVTGGTTLAASATVIRYLKQIHVANTTASAATFSTGVGASLIASTSLVFGESIPANTVKDYFFSPGIRIANLDVRALSGTNLALQANYVWEEEVV